MKKLDSLRYKAMKNKKSTFSVKTQYSGIPIIIAFNGKETRAFVRNGKYSNSAIVKRNPTDERDDDFSFRLAKTRAAIGALKTVRSKGFQSLTKEIKSLEEREKKLISEKYPK